MRRIPTLSLILLLVLSSFTLAVHPVAAAFPRPVADAGSDQTVEEDEVVTLDASGSYDLSPGETLTYRWDLDSGNGTGDVDARGKIVTTTYEDAGIYTVTLTVSDGDLEDTDTCRITVTPTSPDNIPPVAIIREPLPGVYNLSEPIDFVGTFFDPDEGQAHTGEWDFGDDTTSHQPETQHTYTSDGAKLIRWTVKDPHANDTARVVIYIGESPTPEQNERPDAVANASKTNVSVDEVITFDATGSSDADGDPLEFEWDFNIRDGIETESTLAVTTHSYNETGTYTVLLQVRDGKQGGWDYATIDITVSEEPNDPPVANAGNDAQVEIGVALTFRGTATDPDGDEIVLYMWDFGDGAVWESETSGQTNHTYREAGTYSATFTAEDERGERGSDTRMVTVNPPPDKPPVANAGNDITQMQGLPVQFYGTGTDDFGIAKYEWDFNNDGIWDWSSERSGSTTHTYVEDGTYTAILRVTDNPRPGNPGPGQTDEDSVIVTILRNQPPTAGIVANTIFPQAGDLVRFQSDSNDPEEAKLKNAWDLDGDGDIDSNAANPTWTYRREGDYRVSLTVTDDYGQSDTAFLTIQVSQTYIITVEISSPIRDLEPGDRYEFRATIANDGNGDDQIGISLSGTNFGWATLSKSLIFLNSTEKQTITITVVVPSSALTTDDAVIAVTAASKYSTSASDSEDIEVHVKQIPGLTTVLDVPSVSIKRGESRENVATVTIKNTGNGPDSFRISFSGDIAGMLRTNTPKVDLAPGESRDVRISIDVVEGAPTGLIKGTIVVSSTLSTAKDSMEFEVDIAGDDDGGSAFPLDLYTLLIIVVVIAVVAGLAFGASRSKRKRTEAEKKPAKTPPKPAKT